MNPAYIRLGHVTFISGPVPRGSISPQAVQCPLCEAPPGVRCQTGKGKITDYHAKRESMAKQVIEEYGSGRRVEVICRAPQELTIEDHPQNCDAQFSIPTDSSFAQIARCICPKCHKSLFDLTPELEIAYDAVSVALATDDKAKMAEAREIWPEADKLAELLRIMQP